MRFANWLHNGQPITGIQDVTTTEDGAYELNGYTGTDGTWIVRKPGALFFIPSEDEWYKAAYHRNDGVTGNYWDYPTASDSQPINTLPDPGNHASFYDYDGTGNSSFTIGPPYYRTEVGAFDHSASPYGTFDQGGNTLEWNETVIQVAPSFDGRGMRGGMYDDEAVYLLASFRTHIRPDREFEVSGFRVAAIIPEPSTLLLAALTGLGLLCRRRGLVCASILATTVGVSFADRAVADTFGSGANTFDIEFVTIGNPGNAVDTTGDPNPAGSVPYSYRIGKFEISEEMIDKANTLGGLGITKDSRGPNKPATSVSWLEAAKFVNWLNTSTGSVPAYKFDGRGNFQLWTASDAGYNPNNLYRNHLARYFLPSVHEWYKAAYYDPSNGVYYDYPTGSDNEPAPVASGTAAGTAVWDQPFQQGPADITLAGGLSPYGTMGQGGNVWEWEETDLDLLNDDNFFRGVRGEDWAECCSLGMMSSDRNGNFPTHGDEDNGFRVASIPEPNTLALLGLGLLLRGRRTRC